MKVSVFGSRGLDIPIDEYIPEGTTEIITGGSRGIDTRAMKYAHQHGLKLTVHRPDYKRYGGKAAPHIRNRKIIDDGDQGFAIWDGRSKGTQATIEYARRKGKPCQVFIISGTGFTV